MVWRRYDNGRPGARATSCSQVRPSECCSSFQASAQLTRVACATRVVAGAAMYGSTSTTPGTAQTRRLLDDSLAVSRIFGPPIVLKTENRDRCSAYNKSQYAFPAGASHALPLAWPAHLPGASVPVRWYSWQHSKPCPSVRYAASLVHCA